MYHPYWTSMEQERLKSEPQLYEIWGKSKDYPYPVQIDGMPLMEESEARDCVNYFNKKFKTQEYQKDEQRIYWLHWWVEPYYEENLHIAYVEP